MSSFKTPLLPRTSLPSKHPRRNAPSSGFRKETIQRLSTPRGKDKRWIPDKPSVYWLDYLIDPTVQQIKDPEELASYYANFEPRFPRTRLLSAPRKYYGTLYSEEEDAWSRPISAYSGIPTSALSYVASDRIKDLAKPNPRTATPVRHDHYGSGDSKLRPMTSKRSLPPIRSQSPHQNKGRYFNPTIDLARGDYSSRSKQEIHIQATKEGRHLPDAGQHAKSRSRSRKSDTSIKDTTFSNSNRQPLRKNRFSIK